MKHNRDYEGGETWEEEQAAQEDDAGYPGAAQDDDTDAGYQETSPYDVHSDDGNLYSDDEQGDDIDEEDRILAQTRAALQDYDEQGGDKDTDREAEEDFYPYPGNTGTGQDYRRPYDHEQDSSYPGPTPQFDPYTGKRLTSEQQRRMQAQQRRMQTQGAENSFSPAYPAPASESARNAKRDRTDRAANKRNRKKAKKREQQYYSGVDAGENRRRKKRHPVRNFFLILLLIVIVVPLLWILVQVRTMQSLGMDNDQIQESIADTVKENVANGSAQGEYKNIAILGVDSVDNSLDSGNNRSDVMIIASVNYSTGAIRLMSVYRDTYLDIGDGNYQKANAAYAYGGPDQTVQMLNRNLDLDITDYGVVGFEGIARLIDAVGGVEIDVQEDEIVHLNNYQITMSEETGLTNIPVTHAGTQTLNGLQATAYCRIRYTNGNDFKRTERQRTVLTKTFEKIKANPLRLVANLNSILPYVKTSLSVPELFSLGLRAMNFNVESQEGFPSQDLLTVGYINQQSCIIPITLARNVTWLHSELFGETDYQPSQTVQDISAHISAVTGYY